MGSAATWLPRWSPRPSGRAVHRVVRASLVLLASPLAPFIGVSRSESSQHRSPIGGGRSGRNKQQKHLQMLAAEVLLARLFGAHRQPRAKATTSRTRHPFRVERGVRASTAGLGLCSGGQKRANGGVLYAKFCLLQAYFCSLWRSSSAAACRRPRLLPNERAILGWAAGRRCPCGLKPVVLRLKLTAINPRNLPLWPN